MITIDKLKEYEEYRGYYDGFYIQKVKKNENLTSDEEWIVIESLVNDCHLQNNGVSSEEYSNNLEFKLIELCLDRKTIEYLKNISRNNW